MQFEKLSYNIIGKAIEIHRILGPGLLEKTYHKCLSYELINAGYTIESEKPLPLIYKEIKLDHGYRIDLLVENKIVIELKCVEYLAPVHSAQVLTYMKLGNYPLGLLINFYSCPLKNGIKRFVM